MKHCCRFFLQVMALFALFGLSEVSSAASTAVQCSTAHSKSFPVLRSRPEEVAALLTKYPKMLENLKYIEDQSQNYWKPESKLPITIYMPPKYQDQFNSTDPIIKRTLEAVWDKMHNQKAFTNFVRGLAEDTAVEMSTWTNPKHQQTLQNGHLSRAAVLKIMVKRFENEGNKDFSSLHSHRRFVEDGQGSIPSNTKTKKYDTDDGFREAVVQGPFLDKAFSDDPHGEDTHFFQASYVADVIWKETNGNPRIFWEFIGSKKGIFFWDILFEGGGASYASPEYVGAIIRRLLALQ